MRYTIGQNRLCYTASKHRLASPYTTPSVKGKNKLVVIQTHELDWEIIQKKIGRRRPCPEAWRGNAAPVSAAFPYSVVLPDFRGFQDMASILILPVEQAMSLRRVWFFEVFLVQCDDLWVLV